MTVIIDYGVGSLCSLTCSFKKIGADVTVSDDPEIIRNADRRILPGVGAFEDAAAKLKESGLDKILIEKAESGTPVLGVCLGMQLLFERSFEYGEHVYFVHSYYAPKDVPSAAVTSDYGIEFAAAVQNNNIFGCQFHPEKSGDVGLNILRAFIEIGEN